MGLGMKFNSFECRLEGVDLVESDGDKDGDGIWDYLNLHLSRGSALDDMTGDTKNGTGSVSDIINVIVLSVISFDAPFQKVIY